MRTFVASEKRRQSKWSSVAYESRRVSVYAAACMHVSCTRARSSLWHPRVLLKHQIHARMSVNSPEQRSPCGACGLFCTDACRVCVRLGGGSLGSHTSKIPSGGRRSVTHVSHVSRSSVGLLPVQPSCCATAASFYSQLAVNGRQPYCVDRPPVHAGREYGPGSKLRRRRRWHVLVEGRRSKTSPPLRQMTVLQESTCSWGARIICELFDFRSNRWAKEKYSSSLEVHRGHAFPRFRPSHLDFIIWASICKREASPTAQHLRWIWRHGGV